MFSKDGHKITKQVNQADNMLTAAQLYGFISAERAADLFINVAQDANGDQSAENGLLKYN